MPPEIANYVTPFSELARLLEVIKLSATAVIHAPDDLLEESSSLLLSEKSAMIAVNKQNMK